MSYVNHSRLKCRVLVRTTQNAFREVCGIPAVRCVDFMDVGAALILKNIHLLAIEEEECYW